MLVVWMTLLARRLLGSWRMDGQKLKENRLSPVFHHLICLYILKRRDLKANLEAWISFPTARLVFFEAVSSCFGYPSLFGLLFCCLTWFGIKCLLL